MYVNIEILLRISILYCYLVLYLPGQSLLLSLVFLHPQLFRLDFETPKSTVSLSVLLHIFDLPFSVCIEYNRDLDFGAQNAYAFVASSLR